MGLPDGKGTYPVRQKRVEPNLRLRPANKKFSHVGNIENPDLLPDRFVLGKDTRVLDRHFPAGKINHAATGRDMFGIECCAQLSEINMEK